MKPCIRPPAPPQITAKGADVSQKYADKRSQKPNYEFSWPPALYREVLIALKTMTQEHCAYCDFYPVDNGGKGQIDHFQPKTNPSFYLQACAWENLFYSCERCNGTKLARWDVRLLRPDMIGYQFSTYFLYEADSGKIVPNPKATQEQQIQAQITIDMFDFNYPSRCKSRKRMLRDFDPNCSPEEYDENPYRYLIDLLLDVESD
jgi:uncharacterized protein (TIGR02646 family)